MVEIERPRRRRKLFPTEVVTAFVVGAAILAGLAIAASSGLVALPPWLHA
jgi:hypothetical protein